MQGDTMSKSSTISFRAEPELEAQLDGIAEAEGTTLSTLMYEMAVERVERDRRRYLRLKAVFSADQGLHGKSGEHR